MHDEKLSLVAITTHEAVNGQWWVNELHSFIMLSNLGFLVCAIVLSTMILTMWADGFKEIMFVPSAWGYRYFLVFITFKQLLVETRATASYVSSQYRSTYIINSSRDLSGEHLSVSCIYIEWLKFNAIKWWIWVNAGKLKAGHPTM